MLLALRGERGIGLFEVMAGTLIATLAVIGLAYTFGIGRGLIDRYQVARVALAETQGILDSLATHVPSPAIGTSSRPFNVAGIQAGTLQWTISWVDDPADKLSPTDPDPNDLKRAVVVATWSLGTPNDRLALTRMLSK
jgi:hypothetical protein